MTKKIIRPFRENKLAFDLLNLTEYNPSMQEAESEDSITHTGDEQFILTPERIDEAIAEADRLQNLVRLGFYQLIRVENFPKLSARKVAKIHYSTITTAIHGYEGLSHEATDSAEKKIFEDAISRLTAERRQRLLTDYR